MGEGSVSHSDLRPFSAYWFASPSSDMIVCIQSYLYLSQDIWPSCSVSAKPAILFFLRERKEELIWGREEAEGKDWEEWREGKPWLSCNAWEKNKSFLKTNRVLCWCCSFGRGRSHRLLLCTVHKEQVDQWAAHRCNVYKFQIEAHGNRGAYWLHWH